MIWQVMLSLATLLASSQDRQQEQYLHRSQHQQWSHQQHLPHQQHSSHQQHSRGHPNQDWSQPESQDWSQPESQDWNQPESQEWDEQPHREHYPDYAPRTPRDIAQARQALQGDHHGGDMILPDDFSDAGIKDTKYRWQGYPGGAEVPYVIDPSLADQRELITRAMAHYQQRTCIRFVPRTNQRDYIKIFRGNGCYSRVGRVGGEQPLSLGVGCHYIGTIVHELAHALGLFHEHQRSDRDSYIKVYSGNVTYGQLKNFKITPSEQEVINTPFNYHSIMIYGNYAFSKRPGKLMTMTAKSGSPRLLEPYEKPGLDETDVDQIKQFYQCR